MCVVAKAVSAWSGIADKPRDYSFTEAAGSAAEGPNKTARSFFHRRTDSPFGSPEERLESPASFPELPLKETITFDPAWHRPLLVHTASAYVTQIMSAMVRVFWLTM